MDNHRSSAMHYQNQGTNTNANGAKNRNRKKKNKQNKNQNVPMPPSNNIINHYDDYAGSMSLDHQSFSRPFSQFPSNQNYVYNNRANYNNGKYNNRRNGSQSNYYSSGTYENDRLNKSLTPNSSFGENQRIQTSISLDNFDLVSSLNAKRSPSSSYPLMSSNVVIGQKPNSPFKNGTYQQQQQIIEEQANLEEMSETTTSLSMHDTEAKSNDVLSSITSTESLNTSGDFMVDHHTPLSNYSTPMNHSDSSRVFDPDLSPKKHREHEESLNQNDKTPIRYDESEHTAKHSEVKSDDSSALSSNSSPDSKNSDQNLVTASEGESSFSNEQIMPNHQEHNLAKELEKIAANFELNVHKDQDTESNKSVNGSADSSATESYATTSNERDDEMKVMMSEHQSNVEVDNEGAKMEQLVIQEVRLEQDEDKKEQTVIEERTDETLGVDDGNKVECINEKGQCVDEQTSDHAIEDLSLEENKEQTFVEVNVAMSEQNQQPIQTRFIDVNKIEEVTQESPEMKKEEGTLVNNKEENTEESTDMKKDAVPEQSCKDESTEMKKDEVPEESCKDESTEMKKEAVPEESCKDESTKESTEMKKDAVPEESCKDESTEMKKEAVPEQSCKDESTKESTEMKKEAVPEQSCKDESTEMKKEAVPEQSCKKESTEMMNKDEERNEIEKSTETIKEEGPVEGDKQKDTEEALKEKYGEEKAVDLREVKVESEQLTVVGQSVDTKDEQNSEIIIGTGAYEIKIRPHVEEINLTDGKRGSDLKIAPVETDSNEQACDDDHQEFEILEQSNDSIVSEPNDRTNTSINQKEPAVDCFSCTIV